MSPVDRLICHVLPKAFLMALVAEGQTAVAGETIIADVRAVVREITFRVG